MNTLFGIAEYLKEDYEEILRLSDDRDDMDQSWEDWKKSKGTAEKNFEKAGIEHVDVLVRPKELVAYCRGKGLRINGGSRSGFVADKLKNSEK